MATRNEKGKFVSNKDQVQSGLSSKAVLVKVTPHRMGFSVRDKMVDQNIIEKFAVTNAKNVRARKDIFIKEDVKDLEAKLIEARTVTNLLTLPWKDGGYRLLSTGLYSQFEEKVRKVSSDIQELSQKLANNLDDAKERARVALGNLYDPNVYPTKEEILDTFKLDVCYDVIPTSSDIRVDAPAEVLTNIQENMKVQYEEATKQMMKDVYDRIYAVTSRISERMKATEIVKEGGKTRKPRLSDGIFDSVRELVDLLPHFNVLNDPKLDAMKKRLEEEFSTIVTSKIKDDDLMKKQLAEKADGLLKDLEGII